jgi:hypothetical protein
MPKLSYQGSLPYAKERISMRSVSGKKEPDKSCRRADLATAMCVACC